MKLSELRKRNCWSRTALEKMAGLKPRTLERYETGVRNQNKLPLDIALKVADALHIDPHELLIDEATDQEEDL